MPGIASSSAYTLPYDGAAVTSGFFVCINTVRRPAPGQTDTYRPQVVEIDRITGVPTDIILREHTFTITAP